MRGLCSGGIGICIDYFGAEKSRNQGDFSKALFAYLKARNNLRRVSLLKENPGMCGQHFRE